MAREMVRHLPFLFPRERGTCHVMLQTGNREIALAPAAGGRHRGDVVPLIGDYDVAKNLRRVPYPYHASTTPRPSSSAHEGARSGHRLQFRHHAKSGRRLYRQHAACICSDGGFEFGYWLGKPYWGQGYATEAARRLVSFAFRELKVERLRPAGSTTIPPRATCCESWVRARRRRAARLPVARPRGLLPQCGILTADEFREKKAEAMKFLDRGQGLYPLGQRRQRMRRVPPREVHRVRRTVGRRWRTRRRRMGRSGR